MSTNRRSLSAGRLAVAGVDSLLVPVPGAVQVRRISVLEQNAESDHGLAGAGVGSLSVPAPGAL
jgi:hypothetical protein